PHVWMAAHPLATPPGPFLSPARVDLSRDAPRHEQIAVAVEIALVSSAVPFTEKRVGVFVGIRLVTPEHIGSTHHDLAKFAARQSFTAFVHDPYFPANANPHPSPP